MFDAINQDTITNSPMGAYLTTNIYTNLHVNIRLSSWLGCHMTHPVMCMVLFYARYIDLQLKQKYLYIWNTAVTLSIIAYEVHVDYFIVQYFLLHLLVHYSTCWTAVVYSLAVWTVL